MTKSAPEAEAKKESKKWPNGKCAKCGFTKEEHGGPYNGIWYACPPFVEVVVRMRE